MKAILQIQHGGKIAIPALNPNGIFAPSIVNEIAEHEKIHSDAYSKSGELKDQSKEQSKALELTTKQVYELVDSLLMQQN